MKIPIKFTKNYWVYWAVCIFAIVSAAAVFWIKDHPFAFDGDEGEFIDTAYQDFYCVKDTSFLHFLRSDYRYCLTAYAPAFRLLSLPATLTFGPSPFVLRLSSWFCFSLTVFFLYLTVRNLANDSTSGAFAVVFLSLCPMAVYVSKLLMTEPSVNLAIAMMFYFCFKDWDDPQRHEWGWIGLGVALGLGILAKLSFALIASPVLLMMLWLKSFKTMPGLSLSYLLKASLVGLVMAFDWYRNNFYDYIHLLTHVTTHNVRHSFGVHLGLQEKFKMGFVVFTESETGPYLWAMTMLLILITIFRHAAWEKKKKLALGVCFLSMIPTLVAFFGGINNNSRYLSPLLVPLAMAFGLMAGEAIRKIGFLSKVFLIGLVCFQLLVMIVPAIRGRHFKANGSIADSLLIGNLSTVFEREDQWDWGLLKKLCDQRHLIKPSIRYLGNGLQMKSFLIKFPWQKHKEKADVDWRIWQYEQGPINWKKIFKRIDKNDVVLTAPALKGYIPNKDYLDNINNSEFVKRLEADPHFEGPVILPLGRFEPVDVYVFFHRRQG